MAEVFAQKDLGSSGEVLSPQIGDDFILDQLLAMLGRSRKIAILQDGAEKVGLANRPEGVPEEILPHILIILFSVFLKERDHLQIFPHAGKSDTGSPRYLPIRGQKVFVKDIGDIDDSTAEKELERTVPCPVSDGYRRERVRS